MNCTILMLVIIDRCIHLHIYSTLFIPVNCTMILYGSVLHLLQQLHKWTDSYDIKLSHTIYKTISHLMKRLAVVVGFMTYYNYTV